MPRRDGRGPTGRGAMTGRGLGPCNSADRSELESAGRGFGSGRSGSGRLGQRAGMGRGMGRGRGVCRDLGYRQGFGFSRADLDGQDLSERDLLKMQKETLERRLELIDNELENL